jgi:hypothetical protein
VGGVSVEALVLLVCLVFECFSGDGTAVDRYIMFGLSSIMLDLK